MRSAQESALKSILTMAVFASLFGQVSPTLVFAEESADASMIHTPDDTWLTDDSMPENIFDIERKALALGVISPEQMEWRVRTRNMVSPEDWINTGADELVKVLLQKKLDARTRRSEPDQKNTGFYRHREQVEDWLGPENAVWCNKDEPHCTPPTTVSVLCDISQPVTCQTIARAIRMSERLFLLYPHLTTPEQQQTEPDIILMYGKNPGTIYYGMITIEKSNWSKDEIVLKKKHNSQLAMIEAEKPSELMANQWEDVERVLEKIEEDIFQE